MATIEEIIQRELNPFDPATFTPGNFWNDGQTQKLTVDSIHQSAINEIESILSQVSRDHRTRTALLYGDAGSGKSHLLGRLKDRLIDDAHFVYIGPYPMNDGVWRHILRYTIDGLAQTPEGQKKPQLLCWLQSLDAYQAQSSNSWTPKGRKMFIQSLKQSYPTGIYNSEEFFGVLYDLTKPELYLSACEWLKGDDVSEKTLKTLKVRNSIDTEDAAQKIFSNFGNLSIETKPIALCFDNIENIPRMEDEKTIDLQGLLNVNSSIHNQLLKNLLIIISGLTSILKESIKKVQPSDKARITHSVRLRQIPLDEAESIWESRLRMFHKKANPRPDSLIAPLKREYLEKNFSSGRTTPRYALEIGRRVIEFIKEKGLKEKDTEPPQKNRLEAFRLIWHKNFNETRESVTRIRRFPPPELIKMLQEALEALGFENENIRVGILSGSKYSNYSLSYEVSKSKSIRVGVVWTDEPSTKSFFHTMKFCEKAVVQNTCHILNLVRQESTGTKTGHKLFTQIFTHSPHTRIKTDLLSIHYLATYHKLVNAVLANELVIEGKTVKLDELKDMIRQSEFLNDCHVLQGLKVVSSPPTNNAEEKHNAEIKTYLLDLIKTQKLLCRQILIQNADRQFGIGEPAIGDILQDIIEDGHVKVLDPNVKLEDQSICYIPESR